MTLRWRLIMAGWRDINTSDGVMMWRRNVVARNSMWHRVSDEGQSHIAMRWRDVTAWCRVMSRGDTQDVTFNENEIFVIQCTIVIIAAHVGFTQVRRADYSQFFSWRMISDRLAGCCDARSLSRSLTVLVWKTLWTMVLAAAVCNAMAVLQNKLSSLNDIDKQSRNILR